MDDRDAAVEWLNGLAAQVGAFTFFNEVANRSNWAGQLFSVKDDIGDCSTDTDGNYCGEYHGHEHYISASHDPIDEWEWVHTGDIKTKEGKYYA